VQTAACFVPVGLSCPSVLGWHPPWSAAFHASSSRVPSLAGVHKDHVTDSNSKGNLHDAVVRVGAEALTGACAAWAGGDIGENAGMLIGAFAGTFLAPGVGTAVGAALGGVAGELVGALGGAAIGTHLGAMVANDLVA